MAEIKRKIKQRAGHRTHVTKVINSTKELLSSTELNGEIESKLKASRATLTIKRDVLETLNNQILELMDVEEDLEAEVVESSDFETSIDQCVEQIDGKIGKKEEKQSTSESANLKASATPSQAKAKLPKLFLKEFSGNATEWAEFWESFYSAVDSNPELSPVDKFIYLRSLLKGSAEETISGFSLSEGNYKEAIKLLSERYGNKQITITAHMDAILKLPQVDTISDVPRLRSIYDNLEARVRNLQNIGVSANTYETFITPIVMSKIPEELRIIISRKFSDQDNWNLQAMLRALREEIQVREKCAFATSHTAETPKTVKRAQANQPATTSALLTESSPNQPSQALWCTYCKGSHASAKCSTVTDPHARKAILREKGRCFICLKGNHVSREARKKKV